VLPQILLCGLFQPRDEMAPALETLSGALPLTYAFDALLRAAGPGNLGSRFTLDLIVLVGAALLALGLGAATLRRRTVSQSAATGLRYSPVSSGIRPASSAPRSPRRRIRRAMIVAPISAAALRLIWMLSRPSRDQ